MNILSKLFPQNEFIGIHIGYEQSHITVGGCHTSGMNIEWQKTFQNEDVFSLDREDLNAYFTNIFSLIPTEYQKRYLPVQIALPDTLFKTHNLTFTNFPRTSTEQNALVNWKLSKASHCDANDIYSSWQTLKTSSTEQIIFAYGIDKNIIEGLEAASLAACFKIGSINAASVFRYNLLGNQALNQSGVLLSLEKEYWSLMFWENNGELNHIHTEKRKLNESQDDISNIVIATERLVMSYIQQGKSVESVYITAITEEKDSLKAEINQRLENECKWLNIPGISSDKINDGGIVDIATIIKQ